jgi:dihydroxyacetone kinase-like protein
MYIMKNSLDINDIMTIFSQIGSQMKQNEPMITKQDSVYGNGELGKRMIRGFEAVQNQLPKRDAGDIGNLLQIAGSLFGKHAPSTLGSLLSSGLRSFGTTAQGKRELDLGGLVNGISALVNAISLKGAQPGQKTILDALIPGLEALQSAKDRGQTLPDALQQAQRAAELGAVSTKQMMARHGSAAEFAERSIGHQDPGATVGSLIMKGLAGVFSKQTSGR